MAPFRFLFFILCLLALQAAAQSDPYTVNYLHEYAFNSPNIISDVKIASNGDVYIVTFGEVTRYNSDEFKILGSSKVNRGAFVRIYENDRHEKYLVDHIGKVHFINGDKIVSFPFNDSLVAASKGQLFVDVHFDDRKQLHISYTNNKYIVVDSNGKVHRPLAQLKENFRGFACRILSDGHPFMVKNIDRSKTAPTYFYLLNAKEELVEKIEIPDHPKVSHNEITTLQDGSFLYYSGYGHIIRFNSTNILEQTTSDAPIIDLFADLYGGLWVSHTLGQGIHYYPSGKYGVGEHQTMFEDNEAVQVRAQDFQGGLWVFGRPFGLRRIHNPGVIYHDLESELLQGFAPNSTAIKGDSLFLGASDGMVRIADLANGEQTDYKLENTDGTIYRMYHPEGENRVWMGLRSQLYLFENDTARPMFKPLLDSIVRGRRLSFSPQPQTSSVSVAALFGNRYLLIKDTSILHLSRPHQTNIRHVICVGDSTWVGTEDGLILETPDTLIDYSKINTHLQSLIYDLVYFNNKLFVSIGNKGIFYFSNGAFFPVKALGHQLVNAKFLRLSPSVMWVLSDQASFKLTGNSLKTPFGFDIEKYASLPNNFLMLDPSTDGTTFYSTLNGGEVTEFSLSALKKKPYTPTVFRLQELLVNGEVQSLKDSVFYLSPKENNISLRFLGISYEDKPIYYQYRLVGKGEAWQPTDRNLQFVSLPPGTYALELQTRSESKPWSSTKALTFHIALPFWQRWWFIALVVLAISGLGFFVASLRNRILNREKVLTIKRLSAEQKALRAKMDPHFVFNIVASLQYLIGSNENEKASQFLHKFASIMRNTLDQTNQETNSIGGEVRFLKEYMELEQLRLEGKFEFALEVDPQMESQQEIPNFLIQPLVENAIQHGIKNKEGKGHLEIDFLRSDNYLKVVVKDDGVGYATAQQYKTKGRQSHGLNTIRDRLLLHNGKSGPPPLQIESLADDSPSLPGTRVTLFILLKPKYHEGTNR